MPGYNILDIQICINDRSSHQVALVVPVEKKFHYRKFQKFHYRKFQKFHCLLCYILDRNHDLAS